MTNLEALQSVIGGNYPFDENAYQKNLLDNGLNASDAYSSANIKAIDICFAGMLLTVITSVDIKEGGYSVTNADRDALIKVMNGIYTKYGLPIFVGAAKLNDASNKW